MKKLLSVILSVLMVCSVATSVSLTAHAADTSAKSVAAESNGLQYTILDDGTMEITGYTGTSKDLVIPSSIDNKTVTRIGTKAFEGSTLTSLTLPDTIVTLGAMILSGNTGVTSITIPAGVTKMHDLAGGYKGAFYNSGIEKAVFADGIKTIPARALEGATKLKEVSLPETVTSIDSLAFINTALTSLTLPSKLETLGASILAGNTGVKEVTIPKTVKAMHALDGGYKGVFNNSVVETVVFEEGIQAIPYRALQGATKLTSVIIPETVTAIDSLAFVDTALTSLTLPSKLETLGASILAGNTGVKEVTIPKTVKTMHALDGGYKGALNNSAVENVIFDEGIRALPQYALMGATKLVNVTIPMRVKTIGNNAFDNTNTDFTIHGYDGSAAHNYAKTNSVNYVSLGVEPLDTTITLAKDTATIYLTGKTKIKATVKNGVGSTIYRSTNTKVATVNAKGVVTAKKAGIAKITVTNNDVTKTFTVTVKKPTLNNKKLVMVKGKSAKLKVIGKVGKASFTTSNKKVATVDSKGQVVAKKNGKTTITVKTNGINLKCKITVK